jgi:hypothetical protein
MQGTLPKNYDVTRPVSAPSDTLEWSATLPQIGRTPHCVDAWREIDAMQRSQNDDE